MSEINGVMQVLNVKMYGEFERFPTRITRANCRMPQCSCLVRAKCPKSERTWSYEYACKHNNKYGVHVRKHYRTEYVKPEPGTNALQALAFGSREVFDHVEVHFELFRLGHKIGKRGQIDLEVIDS